MTGIKPSTRAKLQVETSPRSRKYRGDAGDLHFIPKSPIVSRQTLTAWQEEELIQACTSLLEGTPHSDATAVPELQHLASHIIVDFPSVPRNKHEYSWSKNIIHAQSSTVVTKPRDRLQGQTGLGISTSDESATPSTISKHDTASITAFTTPATSTNVSPLDVLVQFPDKTPNLPVSQYSHLSHSRRNTARVQSAYSLTHEFAKCRSQSSSSRPSVPVISASAPRKSHTETTSKTKAKTGRDSKNYLVNRPAYNKSLPDIPKMKNFFEPPRDPWSTNNTSFDLQRHPCHDDQIQSTRNDLLKRSDLDNIVNKKDKSSRFQFLSIFSRKLRA